MNRREFIQGGLALAATAPILRGSSAAGALESRAPGSPRFHDARDWWFRRRFGLFVHWGLYAIDGYHEQEQWRRAIPRSEYVKLAERWNPTRFDPEAWLDLAEAAGMRYVCFTAKHHDGFCLWASRATEYTVARTPFRRDALRMLADACHRRGVPLCLYYSVLDWHHPNYPNQGRSHELPPQPGDRPDLEKYVEYVRRQIGELCTEYGEIHGIWWDMNVTGHVDPSINATIRRLQPKAVINNRGFDPGDFSTPERDYQAVSDSLVAFERRTEACQSVGSESWGWRTGESYFTDRHLLRSISGYLARDANYLLNVGPQADGRIGDQAAGILRRIGRWHGAVGEAFSDSEPATHYVESSRIVVTRQGACLYVLLFQDPSNSAVKLKPIAAAPRRATLLNDGSDVRWAVEPVPSDFPDRNGYLRLTDLPVDAMADTVLVVKLEFAPADVARFGTAHREPKGGSPANA